mmetsp:Transcript_8468/g.29894  ORF Transcript_8468/g.29894 Transcript_8468/m.29894 type:complete len:277 (-) Transcript_8468:1217-2047(-)
MAPAFLPRLPGRKTLATQWMPKLAAATEEKADAHLKDPGRKFTAIIDGFKDRKKRHVMNMSRGVRGFVAYLKTAWFGRRRHTGDVYGEELVSALGDEMDNTIAIVADNTGSMSSMQNGLFGWLRRKFPKLLLLGCAVHVLDLLEEDIAKLFFIVSIVEKAKFIVVFVLRYSLIHETFLELQLGRKAVDKSASMLQLKTFPDTRFAYAVLMIVSVLLNWSVLAMIVDTADYKLCKWNVKPAQRRDFEKFEDFVQSGLLKRHCLAAREVMSWARSPSC